MPQLKHRCPKLVNSDLFVGKHATVPIKSQGVIFSRNKSLIITFGTSVIKDYILDQFHGN